jgi:hypothetical protein
MTLPVSTSSGRLAGDLLDESCCSPGECGVVGHSVDSAGPDDAYPGAGWSLTGALRRFSLSPVPVPGGTGGGGVMLAVAQRPPQAVAPAPAESQRRAPYRCP